jgi:hypothetical protein
LQTKHDTALTLQFACDNGAATPVNRSVGVAPSHGSVNVDTLIYTPAPHYAGQDSFSLVGDDGNGGQSWAVHYLVNVTNATQPNCTYSTGVLKNHTPVAVTLSCADADGDPVSYPKVSAQGGTVSGTAPNLVFTPDGDGLLGRLFYKATDAVNPDQDSGDGTAIELLFPPNELPTCLGPTGRRIDLSYTGTSMTFTPNCSDPEGDTITLSLSESSIVTSSIVAGGTAILNGKSLTFTASAQSDGGSLRLFPRDGHSSYTLHSDINFVCRTDCLAEAPSPQVPDAGAAQEAVGAALKPSGPAARIGAILKVGAYLAQFSAPSPGKAMVTWTSVAKGAEASAKHKAVVVAKGSKQADKAGEVTIKVRLTKKGRALLKGSKRVDVLARGSFAATGGKTVSTTRRIVLKR